MYSDHDGVAQYGTMSHTIIITFITLAHVGGGTVLIIVCVSVNTTLCTDLVRRHVVDEITTICHCSV